jgi:light-regulated signal transduction histidine kinase (bacteriophytochrome)
MMRTSTSTLGDASLVKQVMANLRANTVKYTNLEKTVVIEVGSEDEQSAIVYCIKDNGIGFDEHYADRLFDVFNGLHGTKLVIRVEMPLPYSTRSEG